jgi:hypothetical protein
MRLATWLQPRVFDCFRDSTQQFLQLFLELRGRAELVDGSGNMSVADTFEKGWSLNWHKLHPALSTRYG